MDEVADGVWVRQSEWVRSNAVVVRGDEGLVLVDPGISGDDLVELADDVDALGIPVVAGFSTHLHWDHLLWHARFGDVPRFARAASAEAVGAVRGRAQEMATQSASGIPLDLIGLLTSIPEDGGPVPGELVEHDAHAIGHAALLLADRGVLVAGDMLSDLLVPMLDPRRSGQLDAYDTALDLLAGAARHVSVMVPGHGAVARGADVAARLAADRAYVAALRRGDEPLDARLEQEWLTGPHRANVDLVRADLG
ncbi:MBL fold metallo-hydrolase [Nocardioides currus]|nr:MBL fold metallo-hydrolase [Nocardioides currus]